MGLLGWRQIEFEDKSSVPHDGDDLILIGTLERYYTQFKPLQDGDWNLVIRPDASYRHLLYNLEEEENKEVSMVNKKSKVIECEVRPTDSFNTQYFADKCLAPLVGKKLRITGAFVEDKSHENKTEIHPISSIICEEQRVNSKVITIIALTDNSRSEDLPGSGESKTIRSLIPFENTPSKRNYRKLGKIKQYSLIDFTKGLKPLSVKLIDNYSYLAVDIETGLNELEQGFFYSRIELCF